MTRLWATMQADHDLIWSLLNRLTRSHAEYEASAELRQRLAHQLVALGSVHEAAEELVIWPAVRRRCPDGDSLVGQALAQEHQAKLALNELRRLDAGSQEFAQCVNAVASHARNHISYEQNQIWPRLADGLADEELDALADRWQAARAAAPTRPHPHTPANPALLATTGKVMAAADRLRDRLSGRAVPTP
ncbi:MAG TPA: hemerythrin domain-containing protein [Acidimicrobiales bacterium]|nr:hemerythrin domain-containing protein [Acidimicrobiales bacterium]